MSGRITAKADGAQCSIASPRLLLTARDKPLSQLFTLRRVFLELELALQIPETTRAVGRKPPVLCEYTDYG